MIKIENVVLPSPEQMMFVIQGLRNPMNSWDKSDSEFGCKHSKNEYELCKDCLDSCFCYEKKEYVLGPNDQDLMGKLAAAGTDHRKFMRMMPVMVRITAPLYWWKEFDTYKVGTVANSCSTMHKITAKEFEPDDFSIEHVRPSAIGVLDDTINELNFWRHEYVEWNDNDEHPNLERKDCWWQIIQLLPSSYNQTRNVMLNYEVLRNMYQARKNHKLDEWVTFCNWCETLPYSELITEG